MMMMMMTLLCFAIDVTLVAVEALFQVFSSSFVFVPFFFFLKALDRDGKAFIWSCFTTDGYDLSHGMCFMTHALFFSPSSSHRQPKNRMCDSTLAGTRRNKLASLS